MWVAFRTDVYVIIRPQFKADNLTLYTYLVKVEILNLFLEKPVKGTQIQ